MRFASLIGALAASITLVAAQDASDSDVAIIRAQLVNVVSATNSLDNSVLAFTGPSDVDGLQAASDAVLAALNSGVTAIQPIQGFVTVTQAASQLLDQVNALNTAVQKAVQDLINQKPLIVSSCIGPTVLAQLQLQLTAAESFRSAIASKFDSSNQGLVNNVSQPSIDSLNNGIANYSDQTSLPASCQTASSSSDYVTVTYSDPAVSSSTPAVSSSADVPVSSSAAASPSIPSTMATSTSSSSRNVDSSSGTTGAPSTRSRDQSRTTTTTTICTKAACKAKSQSDTTTTTTVCTKEACTGKTGPATATVPCHSCQDSATTTTVDCPHCKGSATTSHAMYTGGAVRAGSNVLAMLGVAAVIAL